jgi:hypothetical protein
MQSYSYTFYYLQKILKRFFQKNLQKQNKWCKRAPKCQIKESNPCISIERINWFNSKQPMHLHYANKFNYALIYLFWFVLASITKKGEIEREIGFNLFL